MGYKKFHVSIPEVSAPVQLQRAFSTIQANTEAAFDEINKNSILNNVLVTDIEVNTSATINHRLGRTPTGYIIVRRSANANIWDTSITDTQIIINSSANVTISVIIF